MARYERNDNIDLERKLDPYPEFGAFLGDPLALEEMRRENLDSGSEAYEDLSAFTYHELFSDPRLEEDDVLQVDEEALHEMQDIIWRNNPKKPWRPYGQLFEKGYGSSTSDLVEDPVTGIPLLEEMSRARQDPFTDSDYVREDAEGFGEDIPLVGGFFRGRHKASSDRFYDSAAARILQRIGDVDIEVE